MTLRPLRLILLLFACSLFACAPARAQTRTFLAYAGTYSSGTAYNLNDMVAANGTFYISLTANNLGNGPESSAADWAPLTSNGNAAAITAISGDIIASGTGSVTATLPSVNISPGTCGDATHICQVTINAKGLTLAQQPVAIALTGVAGPAGPQGPPGPQGPAGLQGEAGPTGPSGPAGLTGPAGPIGATGATGATGPAAPQGAAGTSGAVAETRVLHVATLKGYSVNSGGTLNIFSATGAGNVERIQLAVSYNTGSPSTSPMGANTLITIAVDGRTYTCPLGMFMLWYGYTTSDGATATTDLFESKYLAITAATSNGNAVNSGFRRINIPYTSSISITLTVPATGTNEVIYTQVEYYPGAAPAGLYPPTRNIFHMVVSDWATSSVTPGQVVQILPTIAGVGELESIYFVTSAPGPTEPTWLEQNPDINVDGSDFRYGGTEDFFGNQFYGDQFHGRADEYGIARFYSAGAPENTTYWTAYRYFRQAPMLFYSSLGMTWQNAGMPGGPATKLGSLAVYYTEN
jgi:hypothetical protein